MVLQKKKEKFFNCKVILSIYLSEGVAKDTTSNHNEAIFLFLMDLFHGFIYFLFWYSIGYLIVTIIHHKKNFVYCQQLWSYEACRFKIDVFHSSANVLRNFKALAGDIYCSIY